MERVMREEREVREEVPMSHIVRKKRKERWALCESVRQLLREEVKQTNEREQESKSGWKPANSKERKDSDRGKKISPRGKDPYFIQIFRPIRSICMYLYAACLPHLQARWDIAERMEGAGSGRRGDAVKDTWVNGREKKQEVGEGEKRGRHWFVLLHRFFPLQLFPSQSTSHLIAACDRTKYYNLSTHTYPLGLGIV